MKTQAPPQVTEAQPLSFDERLSLALAEMDYRIGTTPPLEIAAPPTLHVADVLDSAAEIIRERGWIRRSHESESGVCMVGAIRATDSPHSMQEDALERLLHVIRDRFGDFPSVPSFNDSCADRTRPLHALRIASRKAYILS